MICESGVPNGDEERTKGSTYIDTCQPAPPGPMLAHNFHSIDNKSSQIHVHRSSSPEMPDWTHCPK